jgi:hypothetical protein
MGQGSQNIVTSVFIVLLPFIKLINFFVALCPGSHRHALIPITSPEDDVVPSGHFLQA